jgi:small subunit ribosomal protein S35
MMSPEEREYFDRCWTAVAEDLNNPDSNEPILRRINQDVHEIEKETPMLFPDVIPKNLGYWGEDEEDEIAQVEDDDDQFRNDAITSMAHAELEEHREMREYARIMAWDMPLLSCTIHICWCSYP